MKEFLWNVVTFTGADIDSAGNPFFWHTPIGFICILVILVTAIITVVSKSIKTDLITDLYNWALIGVSCIALLHIFENSNPRHQLQILVIALAIKKLWNVLKHFKERKNAAKVR